jgi:hypothetical protein
VSRIIDKMPPSHRGGKANYPWDEWMDGQARILVKGEDFDVSIINMQNAFSGAARRRGLSCTTTKVSDTEVAVQAVPLNGNPS